MFGTQSVIHTSIGGQLYVYEEQDVFSQLTPSQQHLYLNEGYIESASSMQAAGDYPVRGGYVAHYNANEPEYFGLVHQPDPKPQPRKRDIFEDDDWSKPLYDEGATVVAEVDPMLTFDSVSPNDMSKDDCIRWLKKYGTKKAVSIQRFYNGVYLRLRGFLEKEERERRRVEHLKKEALSYVMSFDMNESMRTCLFEMYVHADEWWESKQIRR